MVRIKVNGQTLEADATNIRETLQNIRKDGKTLRNPAINSLVNRINAGTTDEIDLDALSARHWQEEEDEFISPEQLNQARIESSSSVKKENQGSII